MGTLIVDCNIYKDAKIEIISDSIVKFILSNSNQVRHEKRMIEQLQHYFWSAIFWHCIVNYHNVYTFDNLKFHYCLPLKIKNTKEGTELFMSYHNHEEINCYHPYFKSFIEAFKRAHKIRAQYKGQEPFIGTPDIILNSSEK